MINWGSKESNLTEEQIKAATDEDMIANMGLVVTAYAVDPVPCSWWWGMAYLQHIIDTGKPYNMASEDMSEHGLEITEAYAGEAYEKLLDE